MKRVFEMIEKGYEYRTDGYVIKKVYQRKAITNTGFSTLNRYANIASWHVYPDNEYVMYEFHTLKEAKEFIIKKDEEKK